MSANVWTVSCFVKRDGAWTRVWRTVDAMPDPLAMEALRCAPNERAERRLTAAALELLGVKPGEEARGVSVTPGDWRPFHAEPARP